MLRHFQLFSLAYEAALRKMLLHKASSGWRWEEVAVFSEPAPLGRRLAGNVQYG